MLKTNSTKYQENFKNYILSVIDGEGLPRYIISDKEKINFVMDRFTNEYDHECNRRNTPNHQERFGEWLRGGALNIPMYYGEILNLAKKLLESDTLKNEERIKENYYSFMALQIIRLNENLNK